MLILPSFGIDCHVAWPVRWYTLLRGNLSLKSWSYWKNGMKKKQHKNSEASLSTGLAPEFRRTRGDKIINLDYGLYDSVRRKSTIFLSHLTLSVSD